MTRHGLIAGAVTLAAVLTAGWPAASTGLAATEAGPLAPVVLELAVDGVMVIDGEIVATMTVMARETLSRVQIQVELPAGVERTAGDPSWSGPMAAGEVRIVEVSATLKDAGRRQIIGRVMLAPEGTPIALTTSQWVDVQPGSAPVNPKPPARR